jgi:arylsulfatase A-like enzyme
MGRWCAGLGLAIGCAAPSAPPPNVLVITLDTTRADALSPYGGLQGLTPAADRLAREGVLFTRASTVTPLTIPAHASLHTGLLPPRHGVRDNGDFVLADRHGTLAEAFAAAGYATAASVGAEVTRARWGFGQGFQAYFEDLGPARDGDRWRVERPGRAVVDDALAWLGARDRDRPFFLWVHLFDAHAPYTPPPAAAARAPGRPYLGEVAAADDEVQRLIDALDAEGALGRTWIALTADHGESLGEHGEAMHGVLIYGSTTHIPLIVRPPTGQGRPGARVDAPVSLVDLAPTLAARAGLSLGGVDGIDLGPWLADPGADAPTREGAYVESLYGWRHYGFAPARALVVPEGRVLDGAPARLFPADDPAELVDAAAGAPAVVAAAQAALAAAEQAAEAGGEQRLTADQIELLEQLGYLSGAAAPSGAPPWGADLPDPEAGLPLLKAVERAREAWAAGDLDGAEAALLGVLGQAPGLVDPALLLVRVQLRQGQLDAALDRARALDLAHPSAPTHALLGLVHLHRGEVPPAIDRLEAAVAQDPGFAGGWHPLLHAHYLRGDPAALAAALDRARPHLGEDPVLVGMEGLLRGMSGDLDGARLRLEQALASSPELPFVRHGLAGVALAQGLDLPAEAHLRAEIALQPSFLPSHKALVALLARQRRYAEQLEALAPLRAALPRDVPTAHSIAQARFNLGDPAGALDEARRCAALDHRYPACALLEANALQKLGQTEAAAEALARARALAAGP